MKKVLLVLALMGCASAASAQVSIGGSGSTQGGATVQTPNASGSVGSSGSTGLSGSVDKGGADLDTNSKAGASGSATSGGISGGANLGATVDENAKLKTR